MLAALLEDSASLPGTHTEAHGCPQLQSQGTQSPLLNPAGTEGLCRLACKLHTHTERKRRRWLVQEEQRLYQKLMRLVWKIPAKGCR